MTDPHTIRKVIDSLNQIIDELKSHKERAPVNSAIGFIPQDADRTSLEQLVGIHPDDVQVAITPFVDSYLKEWDSILRHSPNEEVAFYNLLTSIACLTFLAGINYQIQKGEDLP